MTNHQSAMEQAALRALAYLPAGLVLALPLLLVPSSWDRFTVFVVHLCALVLFGLVMTARLTPLAGDGWFIDRGWSARKRVVGSGVAIVVMVTGVVGLVTLASSAALRYAPSLQFLQLLSALDIAWSVAALTIGAWRAWGRTAAYAAGFMLAVACVLSIWNYLRVVGFGADGGWRVDGGELLRLVIPADVVAAVVAIVVFVYGTRHLGRAEDGEG